MRYIVIGCGVAGIAACEGIRSAGDAGEIVLISDDPHGFYSRPGLAYYLTGEMSERGLFPRSKSDWQRLNIRFMRGRVTRLMPAQHQVEINQGEQLSYDRLLLALGSRAVQLDIPGAELEGVVKLDHLDDARRILKFARRGKTAVVIGGGITALELVEGLISRGVKVHYPLRSDRYWRNVLDEDESRLIEQRLQEDGVKLYHQTNIVEILGKRKRVIGARFQDGRILRCDIIAFAIGIWPCAELARDASLNVERGILVDEYLRTSDSDIYAAGDVAQVYDPVSRRAILDSLWGPAREQGFFAGLNMAGQKRAYIKSTPFNVTRLAGLTTTIIGTVGHGRDEDLMGIARGDSETWRELPEAIVAQSGFDVNCIRLLVGEKTLLGAILMGDQTLSIPLQKIISGNIDISSIREKLLAPNPPVTELVADFWSSWRIQHAS